VPQVMQIYLLVYIKVGRKSTEIETESEMAFEWPEMNTDRTIEVSGAV